MINKHNLKIGICPWKYDYHAALTLSFDDVYEETVNISSELAQKSIKATWNVPTSFVGRIFEGRAIASWDELRIMASRDAMEIASHSANHLPLSSLRLDRLFRIPSELFYSSNKIAYLRHLLTMMSGIVIRKPLDNQASLNHDEMPQEVSTSQMIIDEQVPSQKVRSFAYPYGGYDRKYEDIIRSQGYTSARTTYKGYNFYNKVDYYALKSMEWNRYTTPEEANKWVARAVKSGAWLIETFHLIKKGKSEYQWFTERGKFEEHLIALQTLAWNQRIWIDTQSHVSEYMQLRVNSTINILESEPEYFIFGLHSTFDNPLGQTLTIRVTLPPDWGDIEVFQNGMLVPFIWRKRLININLIPNESQIIIKKKS